MRAYHASFAPRACRASPGSGAGRSTAAQCVPRDPHDDRPPRWSSSAPSAATTCSWPARAQRPAGPRPRRARPPARARRRAAPAAAARARRRGPPRARRRAAVERELVLRRRQRRRRRSASTRASAACPTRTSACSRTCIVAARAAVDHARRRDRAAAARGRRRAGHRRDGAARRAALRGAAASASGSRCAGPPQALRRPVRAAARRGRASRSRSPSTSSGRPTASRTSGASPPATRSRAGSAARCASATRRSTFAGPGQRDHSWGARDWWAVDWMWSALHLDDGTHTHAVGVPQMPGFGVGYVQRGGELTEIESRRRVARRSPTTGSSRAPRSRSGPDDLGSTSSRSPSARSCSRRPTAASSHFPRAMCRVRAADGRDRHRLGRVEPQPEIGASPGGRCPPRGCRP